MSGACAVDNMHGTSGARKGRFDTISASDVNKARACSMLIRSRGEVLALAFSFALEGLLNNVSNDPATDIEEYARKGISFLSLYVYCCYSRILIS